MEKINFQRSIPLRDSFDVFVAGGGPSGIAAAWAAAKCGADVFIAEATGCFGGMGTSGGLPMFCYFTDGKNFVSSGFGSYIYERIWEEGAIAPGMKRENPHGAVMFNGEILKRIYDKTAEKHGVKFTFFTRVVDVIADSDGHIDMAVCHGKSGFFAVKAKTFIDCTGDGDLCALAGADFEKGDTEGSMQPGTLCSLWSGIDWDRVYASECGWHEQSKHLHKAFKDKVFSTEDPHMPGLCQISESAGWGNIGHSFGLDGTDERSLTKGIFHAREILPEYEKFFKTYLKGFEKMSLVGTGSLMGVRETRRIIGDYVLNIEDFNRRAIFEDEMGRFAYPVDLHATKPTAEKIAEFEKEFETLRYKPGESYGIPFRVLLPKKLENVLVAGRCISSDRYLQGSIRVMPGCFITGQAAGAAAALSANTRKGIRELPAKEIQSSLLGLGAYLPNSEFSLKIRRKK